MDGTGLPLATPFDADEQVDHDALGALVAWVEDRGVDFVVPCGSNSEAPLLSPDERAAVVETVAEAASVPVLAGTGTPGYAGTLRATGRAADAGADAAMVVTPYYFEHDRDALVAYYRDLADESPLPVYLYSVPAYTGVRLAPGTVGRLADHPNVAGIKDSTGDVAALARTDDRTPDDFDVLVGSGGVYAPALDTGADGGVLALANVVPEHCDEIYRLHRAGEDGTARALNRRLIELNHAVTSEHGVPGLKAAMRSRDAPAGRVRRPHHPVDGTTADDLTDLVEQAVRVGE